VCARRRAQSKGLQKLRWYCQVRAAAAAAWRHGRSVGFAAQFSVGKRSDALCAALPRQVCEKQCRDENGFKCHTTSESHLRQARPSRARSAPAVRPSHALARPAPPARPQMAIFGQNPHKVVDSYSQQLERDFLEHIAMRHALFALRRRVRAFLTPARARSHRNTRVAAQLVYNEYIANKTHIHMNGAVSLESCRRLPFLIL
jgi:hypothetical protein